MSAFTDVAAERKPRITMMGEDIPWDEVPEAPAVELEHYLRPVKLSPRAINEASKIVPAQHWIKHGLYAWLSARAEHVFSKLSSSEHAGQLGCMKYLFEFDADGPVLKTVLLV